MKFLNFFLLLLPTFVLAGTEIQNGGVGLKINGQVATFYSTQINIISRPLINLEGLNELLIEINELHMGPNSKFKLLNAIIPSAERKYFQIDGKNVNESDLKKIIQEYAQKTGLNLQELTVFGITNPLTKTTLLLSDFFQLSPIDREALLFHESLWITGEVHSIEQMLNIEILFQAYLEKKDPESTYDFYAVLGDLLDDNYSWQFYASLKSELFVQHLGNETSVTSIFPVSVLPALTAFLVAMPGPEKLNYSQQLIMQIQKDLSEQDKKFYYSKSAFKNYLLKNALEDKSQILITDQEIRAQYYPAMIYATPMKNPQYPLMYNKLKQGKIRPSSNGTGDVITFLNPDGSELLHIELSP